MKPIYLEAQEFDRILKATATILPNKLLILVRGLPGMGKSYVGKVLAAELNGIQLETDQQFTAGGSYEYDGSRLKAAHESTQQETKSLMIQNVEVLVVTNTFTQEWEYEVYVLLAKHYHYALVIYDLYQYVARRMHLSDMIVHHRWNNTAHNLEIMTNYLTYLEGHNEHQVPYDSIVRMSTRYEFNPDLLTILPVNAEIPVANHHHNTHHHSAPVHNEPERKYIDVLDTGYYLALNIITTDECSRAHSWIYYACILVNQELCKLFGASTAYQMIRKLTMRNVRSHIRAYQQTTDVQTSANKLIKQNAGWSKYHITILNPKEYDYLKTHHQLQSFKDALNTFALDTLNEEFAYLQALFTATDHSVGSDEDSLSGRHFTRLMESTGMVIGPKIVDVNTAGNTNSFVRLDEVGFAAFQSLQIQEKDESIVFYLLMKKSPAIHTREEYTSGVLYSIDSLRKEYLSEYFLTSLQGNTPDWCPHITLAFSYNDIHEELTTSEGSSSGRELLTRLEGLQTFQSFWKSAVYHQYQSTFSTVSSAPHTPSRRSTTTHYTHADAEEHVPIHTNLQPLTAYPLFGELILYSEIQCSFSYAYSFVVIDCKIKKGPFGDDTVYRNHPILFTLLPRGLVFLQHQITRILYLGLYSLPKFYGKEGIEDDGIGMSSSEFAYFMKKSLTSITSYVLMEKVNGRAGSCSFFTYDEEDYVIVGTKLAHTIGKLDWSARKIRLPPEYVNPSFMKQTGKNEGKSEAQAIHELEESEESEECLAQSEMEGECSSKRESIALYTVTDTSIPKNTSNPFDRQALIVSNTLALEQSLVWEHGKALLTYLARDTMNGEILDPEEMHLVTVRTLQWMFLCTTRCPSVMINPFSTLLDPKNTTNTAQTTVQNTVQTMVDHEKENILHVLTTMPQYIRYIPVYEHHDLTSLTLSAKQSTFQSITHSCFYTQDSEGKVLYFLDHTGHPMKLMKYKTWWYIYRRSIREVTSKLFTRWTQAMAGKDGKDEEETVLTKEKTELQRLTKQYEGMSRAKLPYTDMFVAKLEAVKAQIVEVQAKIAAEQLHQSNKQLQLLKVSQEIQEEITRRWLTKFAFLKEEMQSEYTTKVQQIIHYAHEFVEYITSLLREELDGQQHQQQGDDNHHRSEVIQNFRKYYPMIWEAFLIARNIPQDN